MPKITAGTSVKAALLAAFPFLVGINGTEESLHEYLAIFVLLIAVQHLLKQKWWFRMMRFGLRNQPLKLKMTADLLVSFCCTVISEILVSRYALPAARIKAISRLCWIYIISSVTSRSSLRSCMWAPTSKLGNFLPECLICRYSELY